MSAFAKARRWPKALIVSKEQTKWKNLRQAAKKHGIAVDMVDRSDLSEYTDEIVDEFQQLFASIDTHASSGIQIEKYALTDELLARAGVDLPDNGKLSETDEQSIGEVFLSSYYRAWLDQPVPGLGGKTPRQAARTNKGVAELERLFEHMQALPTPASMKPDFRQLRKELGMD